MFHRLATSIVCVFLTLAVLAAAMPGGGSPPHTTTVVTPPKTTTVTVTATAPGTTITIPASQCNTGDIQCCNTVQAASSEAAGALLGLLGIVLQDLTVLVGLTCSPLSIIGGGSNSCTAQPVCCENNSFHGLIAIGCTPINVNL